MSDSPLDLSSLGDDALVRSVEALLVRKRGLDSDLLAHLGEIDERKLWAIRGFDSMLRYCVEALDLSEASARHRIHAARTARRFPLVLEMLRDGRLHVSGVNVLAPHLTSNNHRSLLLACAGRPRGDLELLVAEMFPKPAAPAYIARLPRPETELPLEARPVDSVSVRPDAPRGACAPGRVPRGRIEPLRRELYKVQFTAGEGLRQKLDALQALLRHQVPDGDLATIVEKAVDCLPEQTQRRRFAKTDRPGRKDGRTRQKTGRKSRSKARRKRSSRHIPAELRRAVYERDGGRCRYVAADGRRCASREFLEFEHVEPWADGGEHRLCNLRLLCRAHNQLAAREHFGAEHMRQFERAPGRTAADADRRAPGRVGRAAEPNPPGADKATLARARLKPGRALPVPTQD